MSSREKTVSRAGTSATARSSSERSRNLPGVTPLSQRSPPRGSNAVHRKKGGSTNGAGSKLPPPDTVRKSPDSEAGTPHSDGGALTSSSPSKSEHERASGSGGGMMPPAEVSPRRAESRNRTGVAPSPPATPAAGKTPRKSVLSQVWRPISGMVRIFTASGSSRVGEMPPPEGPTAGPPGEEMLTVLPVAKFERSTTPQCAAPEEQRRRPTTKVKAELFRDVVCELDDLDVDYPDQMSAGSPTGAVPPGVSASSAVEPTVEVDLGQCEPCAGPGTAGAPRTRTPYRYLADVTPRWGSGGVSGGDPTAMTPPPNSAAVATHHPVASPSATPSGSAPRIIPVKTTRVSTANRSHMKPVADPASRVVAKGGRTTPGVGGGPIQPLPATDIDGMPIRSDGKPTGGMFVNDGATRCTSYSRNCSFNLSRNNSTRTSAAKLTSEKEDALRYNRSKFLTRQHTPPPQSMLQMAKQVRRRQLRHAVIPEDDEPVLTVATELQPRAKGNVVTSQPPHVVELLPVSTCSSSSTSTSHTTLSQLDDVSLPVHLSGSTTLPSSRRRGGSGADMRPQRGVEIELLQTDAAFPPEPPELTATSPLLRQRHHRQSSDSFTKQAAEEEVPLVVTYSGTGRQREVHVERERLCQVRLSASSLSHGTPSVGSQSFEMYNSTAPWLSVSKLSHAPPLSVPRASPLSAKPNGEGSGAGMSPAAQEQAGVRDSSGNADGSTASGRPEMSDVGDAASGTLAGALHDKRPSVPASSPSPNDVEPAAGSLPRPIVPAQGDSGTSGEALPNTGAAATECGPEAGPLPPAKLSRGATISLLVVEDDVKEQCLLSGARSVAKGSSEDSRAGAIGTVSSDPKPSAVAADPPCVGRTAPDAESREAAGGKADGATGAVLRSATKRMGRTARSSSWHQQSDGEVDSVRSSWSLSGRRIASAERRAQLQAGPRRVQTIYSDPEDPSSMDDGSCSESGGAADRLGRAGRRSPFITAPRKARGAPEVDALRARDGAHSADTMESAMGEAARAVAPDSDGSPQLSASMKLTGYYGFDVLESLSASSDVSLSGLVGDLHWPAGEPPQGDGENGTAAGAEDEALVAPPCGAPEPTTAGATGPVPLRAVCSTVSPPRTRLARAGADHVLPPLAPRQLSSPNQTHPASPPGVRDWIPASVMHSRDSGKADVSSSGSGDAQYFGWGYGLHYGCLYNDDYDDDGADEFNAPGSTAAHQRVEMAVRSNGPGADAAVKEVGGDKEAVAAERGALRGAGGSAVTRPSPRAPAGASDPATAPASANADEESTAPPTSSETTSASELWSYDDGYEREGEEEQLSDGGDAECPILEGFRPPEFNRPRSAREPCGILFVLTMDDSISSMDEIWSPKRGQFMRYKLLDDNTVRQMEGGEHALHPRVTLKTAQHEGPAVHNVALIALGLKAVAPTSSAPDPATDQSATAPAVATGASPAAGPPLPTAPLLPHDSAPKMTSLLLPTKFKGDSGKVIRTKPNTFGRRSFDGSECSSDEYSYSSDEMGDDDSSGNDPGEWGEKDEFLDDGDGYFYFTSQFAEGEAEVPPRTPPPESAPKTATTAASAAAATSKAPASAACATE